VSNRRFSQFAVPVAVVGIIVMMIVPLPAALIDVLIVVNLGSALTILLVSMYVRRPLDFATFPAILLVATLFRLGLNVSVTRLVLSDGFAGSVVEAFGHVVIGGSLIVGLVIFMILIVIQFVVVTKGAERVAEVGARFTLDAMPGKQMAIDADLNAGLIDDDEARRRRADVAAEADFYGAMDGGSKFVKGDAIAAIIITVINLIGGMAIGILQRGMSPADAVSTYSLLTVGDGLAAQIPALMLSVATGLIVTRATTDGDMGGDVLAQFAGQKRALQVAGAGIIGLGLIPGLPKAPFLIVGAVLLFIASRLTHAVHAAKNHTALEAGSGAPEPVADSPEALISDMRVDPIELELAYDLVDLVDPASGDLLGRVKSLRRKLALELGVVLPPVRTRDDLELPLSAYRIRVHGVELGRGEAPAGHVLVIGEGATSLPGQDTREPVFGLAARWVAAGFQRQAEMAGLTVVDRSSVVITHLAEIARQNAGSLLSREDVRALVDALKTTHPSTVDELTPTVLTLGEIQRVLQSLLDERVPIRDLGRIFDALSTRGRAATGSTTDQLVETARTVLGPSICATLATSGTLYAITLDPLLEQDLLSSLRPAEGGDVITADPDIVAAAVRELARLVDAAEESTGQSPVVVCSSSLRAPLRRLLRGELPRISVLAYSELGGPIDIHAQGVVSLVHAHTA
jgi:flagellar biosynthesis protein FlhA